MKNLLFLFVTMLFNITIYGQNPSYEQRAFDAATFDTFDTRAEGLKGTSYIQNDFLPANIESYNNLMLLRYNAFQDEMEIKTDKIYFIPKKNGLSVIFTGTKFNYKIFSLENNREIKLGFLKVLQNGSRMELLLQEKIIFVEEVKPKTGYEKYEAPRLKREKDKLFYSVKNSVAIEISKKKREILSIFSNNLNEIKIFAAKNKLSFKKQKDLIKIVEYYNTL